MKSDRHKDGPTRLECYGDAIIAAGPGRNWVRHVLQNIREPEPS